MKMNKIAFLEGYMEKEAGAFFKSLDAMKDPFKSVKFAGGKSTIGALGKLQAGLEGVWDVQSAYNSLMKKYPGSSPHFILQMLGRQADAARQAMKASTAGIEDIAATLGKTDVAGGAPGWILPTVTGAAGLTGGVVAGTALS
jgi:hypothetical protein